MEAQAEVSQERLCHSPIGRDERDFQRNARCRIPYLRPTAPMLDQPHGRDLVRSRNRPAAPVRQDAFLVGRAGARTGHIASACSAPLNIRRERSVSHATSRPRGHRSRLFLTGLPRLEQRPVATCGQGSCLRDQPPGAQLQIVRFMVPVAFHPFLAEQADGGLAQCAAIGDRVQRRDQERPAGRLGWRGGGSR